MQRNSVVGECKRQEVHSRNYPSLRRRLILGVDQGGGKGGKPGETWTGGFEGDLVGKPSSLPCQWEGWYAL